MLSGLNHSSQALRKIWECRLCMWRPGWQSTETQLIGPQSSWQQNSPCRHNFKKFVHLNLHVIATIRKLPLAEVAIQHLIPKQLEHVSMPQQVLRRSYAIFVYPTC